MSGIVDLTTTYCLILHYISLGCPPDYVPRQQMLGKGSKLSYYFYIVKTYPHFCTENILFHM